MRKELQGQLQQAQHEWSGAAADQEQLLAQVHSLRQSLEVTYSQHVANGKGNGRVVQFVAEYNSKSALKRISPKLYHFAGVLSETRQGLSTLCLL